MRIATANTIIQTLPDLRFFSDFLVGLKEIQPVSPIHSPNRLYLATIMTLHKLKFNHTLSNCWAEALKNCITNHCDVNMVTSNQMVWQPAKFRKWQCLPYLYTICLTISLYCITWNYLLLYYEVSQAGFIFHEYLIDQSERSIVLKLMAGVDKSLVRFVEVHL